MKYKVIAYTIKISLQILYNTVLHGTEKKSGYGMRGLVSI
jgi:hypothetical protein